MRTFRKFVLLVDVDNVQLEADELRKIIEKVEALGSLNYIKLYGCNDKKIKDFSDVVTGRCCDIAPPLRTKLKSRKSVLDTRIIVDAVKISCTNVADSFAIVAGDGDYGYLLSALKAAGKFIAGRFLSDLNINFCDVYLGEFDGITTAAATAPDDIDEN